MFIEIGTAATVGALPDFGRFPLLFHDVVEADVETGTFIWRLRDPSIWGPRANNFNTRYAGSRAFNAMNACGYLHGAINSRGGRLSVAAHRLVWALATGSWPARPIDHINGQRADNRLANLREVSQEENSRNRRLGTNNTSGQIGVHLSEGLWRAQIKGGDVRRTLGRFATFDEAVRARKQAERQFGYHPNHGAAK